MKQSTTSAYVRRFVGFTLSALLMIQAAAPALAAIEPYGKDDTSAFYWYLCGSSLESDEGAATADLKEMMAVKLPKNVKVIIEAGGAAQWHNGFDAEKLSRYIYDSDGLRLIETIPNANMGDGKILEEFLRFCNTNYPADHKFVDIWSHGGGSIAGVSFDQNYNMESLDLGEIQKAFAATTPASKEKPPYEIIGFDAGLMAGIDVISMLNGYARWMVASEEAEPSSGWEYTGIMESLAKGPKNGGEFGKSIAKSYMAGADWAAKGMSKSCTLSVIDMSKADAVVNAYYEFGASALLSVAQNTAAFRDIARAALATIEYSAADMADFGAFLDNLGGRVAPESAERLRKAIGDAAYFNSAGELMSESTGISFYYNYDNNESLINRYTKIYGENPFIYLFNYALSGELSKEGLAYLGAGEIQPKKFALHDAGYYDSYPITINEGNHMVLTLKPEHLNEIAAMYLGLLYVDESGTIYRMGQSTDFNGDWEKGAFTEGFKGVWGGIGGKLAYMGIKHKTKDYVVYWVPFFMKGTQYTMLVDYIYASGAYEILGYKESLTPTGMAGKNLRQFKPGDEIQLAYLTGTTEKKYDSIKNSSITFTENTRFENIPIPFGQFVLYFEMADILNRPAYSAGIVTRRYTDVTDKTRGAKYIQRLSMYGITGGYPDGEFRPEAPINGAEFSTVLANSLGLEPIANYNGAGFANWNRVPNWARPYVGALTKAGVLDAKAGLNVGNLALSEMAALCLQAYAAVSDAAAADADYIAYVASHAMDAATRADAAEAVCRLLIN